MANKTFCPIMTIGFGPPEKGKRDMRLCMRDCMWYDAAEENCKINVISDQLEYIMSCVDGIGDPNYEDFLEDSYDDT